MTPWIFFLPLATATFVFGQTPWLAAVDEHMQFGRPAHIVLGAAAVFVLAFIYTAYVLDPERAAETLQEQGGAIPGVAPGEPTADHLDRVVSLTTAIGAPTSWQYLSFPRPWSLAARCYPIKWVEVRR